MDNPGDAYSPLEIARRVKQTGTTKANLGFVPTMILAILAGAFISFGALLYTIVITDSPFGYGPTRWLGGISFSLGLVLVIVAGAELFTGNNLIIMAWASKQVSTAQVARNWGIVYVGNLVGAVVTAWLVYQSGVFQDNHMVLEKIIGIGESKVRIDFVEAFFRGLLCNVLVCMAVWLCMAAHSVSGKILAIIFPISAFVAAGFEHSVANMYFIPLAALSGSEAITFNNFLMNLIPVTLGNIVGGGVLVAMVYWLCYLQSPED
jgi:formate transporter